MYCHAQNARLVDSVEITHPDGRALFLYNSHKIDERPEIIKCDDGFAKIVGIPKQDIVRFQNPWPRIRRFGSYEKLIEQRKRLIHELRPITGVFVVDNRQDDDTYWLESVAIPVLHDHPYLTVTIFYKIADIGLHRLAYDSSASHVIDIKSYKRLPN